MHERRLEVADVFRLHADDFPTQWAHVLARHQKKAIADIRNCRTAAMGGHVEQCDRCGQRVVSYNSCRNRNCPKCQAAARAEWEAELLPVPYFHVVFTLPQPIGRLALQNPRLIYTILFRAVSETLLIIATGVIGRSRDESRELHRAFKNTRSQRLASSSTAPAHWCRTICHGDICARCATGDHPKGDRPPRPHISRGTPSFRHPISNATMPAGTPEYGCTYAAAAGLSRSRSTPPPAKARIVRVYGTCASVEWYASENSGWRSSQWTRLTR
jgi:hypothetical protein